jgi:peptidoglycan/xylan/chitin deacetylase (PgdA/CDA1 family)
MIKMDRSKWASMAARALGAALVVMAASAVARAEAQPEAQQKSCPRKDALGTSRILEVDAASTPRVGLKSFPQTLPLADHEVVLTFDDGPWPATTPKVLAALAHECVHATFFLIGKPASEHPELVRRIAAEGHTIGTHTWTHPSLLRIKPDAAVEQIDHGISAVEAVLHGGSAKLAPFFRFPGFESTPATLDLLQSRGIVVFGTDLWASDWNPMTPQEELKLITDRLNASKKGIILLHDPKAQTAAMLPAFLGYLRENDYHVVHLVPAVTGAKAAEAGH